MTNTTVKELIEILKTMNQDAIVCHWEANDDEEPDFSTFEICREFKDTPYIDDGGEITRGDVVAIF